KTPCFKRRPGQKGFPLCGLHRTSRIFLMLTGVMGSTKWIRFWVITPRRSFTATAIRLPTNGLLRLLSKKPATGTRSPPAVRFMARSASIARRPSTEVEEDSCPPKEFIGLKNGGKKNNYIVEGILFQSERLWLRDQRCAVRKFSQL